MNKSEYDCAMSELREIFESIDEFRKKYQHLLEGEPIIKPVHDNAREAERDELVASILNKYSKK